MNDKIKGMMGLAKRAGKLIGGQELVLEAIRSGKAEIVIITTDASDNTKKMFRDKCDYYHVPIFEYAEKTDFGNASMAVCDENFAGALKKLFN